MIYLTRYLIPAIISLIVISCSPPSNPVFPSDSEFSELVSAWSNLKVYSIFQEKVPADPFTYTDPAVLFSRIKDPWTQYISPKDAQQFLSDFSGENSSGLGIFIQTRNGKYYLIRVIANSPAQIAGLKKGDTLISVDGKSLVGVSRDTLSSWLLGGINTRVIITVSRPITGMITDTVIRGPFNVPTVITDTLRTAPGPRIAYIWLTEFMEGSKNEMEQALSLPEISSDSIQILDLRSNPGGLINECVGICGLYLPYNDTLILSRMRIFDEFNQRGSTIDSALKSNGYGTYSSKKIILLVNEWSASAAEMLTTALRENYKKIYIMGNHTYGKARGQVLGITPMGGIARVTFMTITTKKGLDYNNIGLEPDTLLDSARDTNDLWIADAYDYAVHSSGFISKQSAKARQELMDKILDINMNRKLNPIRRKEPMLLYNFPGR